MQFSIHAAQKLFDHSYFFAESVWKVIIPQYFFWTMMLAFAVWLFSRAIQKDIPR